MKVLPATTTSTRIINLPHDESTLLDDVPIRSCSASGCATKDLYIHGVRVSDAKVNLNLLMFSVFNVHLQDVTRSTEKNGIDHYGFVYIGERPTELNKKPQDCEKLQQFLEDKDQFDSFISTWQEVSEGYYSKEDIIKVNIKTKNCTRFLYK